MCPTYHLKHTLGINKATIARNVSEAQNEDEAVVKARELVRRRTQSYTVDELRLLMAFYVTAHQECVTDYPEDYTSVEVYAATAHMARYDAAMEVLESLQPEVSNG